MPSGRPRSGRRRWQLAGDAGQGIDHGEDGEPPLRSSASSTACLPRPWLMPCFVPGPSSPPRRRRRASPPSPCLMTSTKPSRRSSRFSTSASMMRRMSPSASCDLGGVLAGELDHLGRVPDDVVLADRLEPEGRDADRALADLAVPDEEAGGERLAVDLGPAGRVDEEAEHVLLAGIEPGPPPFEPRCGGGWKSIANSRSIVEDVRVVEPRVAVPWMDRTSLVRR